MHPDPARRRPAGPRPDDPHRGDRHPAPHGRPGARSRPASRSSRSASRCSIIALYVDGQRHVLEDSAAILSRANQALATLERYKLRLDEVAGTLSALEIEDLVTVRDVAAVAQRLEMVRRIAARDRRVRGRARHRRPAARPAARRADRRRRAGARAGRPRLRARARPATRSRTVDEALPSSTRSTPPELLDLAIGRPGAGLHRRRPRRSTPRSARAATGCWPRCRGCPAPSSTASSTTSAACRSCSPRASTTCRRSTASARRAPARVREGLSRLAESSILERYV